MLFFLWKVTQPHLLSDHHWDSHVWVWYFSWHPIYPLSRFIITTQALSYTGFFYYLVELKTTKCWFHTLLAYAGNVFYFCSIAGIVKGRLEDIMQQINEDHGTKLGEVVQMTLKEICLTVMSSELWAVHPSHVPTVPPSAKLCVLIYGKNAQ